jgi:hypothetical protein
VNAREQDNKSVGVRVFACMSEIKRKRKHEKKKVRTKERNEDEKKENLFIKRERNFIASFPPCTVLRAFILFKT